MSYFFFVPGTFVSFCLLLTMSYALPSKFESASSSVAEKGNISLPNIFYNLDGGPIGSSQSTSTRASNPTLKPDWPITCNRPSPFPPLLNVADCLYISTTIESSTDAKTFRVYSAAAGLLTWVHRTCRVTMGATHTGYTDVFKPILIAHDIGRVVHRCSRLGYGGATHVGPRMRFALVVLYSGLSANGTAATA